MVTAVLPGTVKNVTRVPVPVAVALADIVTVFAEREETVVPTGIPVPMRAWPATIPDVATKFVSWFEALVVFPVVMKLWVIV